MGAQNVQKTQLAVARGVGVPFGHGLEDFEQPGPLGDVRTQGNVGHGGSGGVVVVGERWMVMASFPIC